MKKPVTSHGLCGPHANIFFRGKLFDYVGKTLNTDPRAAIPFTKGFSSLFVCLSFDFLKNSSTYVHETLHTAFLCPSPEAY